MKDLPDSLAQCVILFRQFTNLPTKTITFTGINLLEEFCCSFAILPALIPAWNRKLTSVYLLNLSVNLYCLIVNRQFSTIDLNFLSSSLQNSLSSSFSGPLYLLVVCSAAIRNTMQQLSVALLSVYSCHSSHCTRSGNKVGNGKVTTRQISKNPSICWYILV